MAWRSAVVLLWGRKRTVQTKGETCGKRKAYELFALAA